MKELSNTQRIALKEIKRVTDRFGKDRWFTQGELIGIGENTLVALVSKEHLNYCTESDISYYQLLPKEPCDADAQTKTGYTIKAAAKT